MALLINHSFFIRDIAIPNTTKDAVIDKVNSFIAKYEPECLLRLLGYPLYKLVGVETSERMTGLVEGAEFTDFADELHKWPGLVHDTDQSLIAYYVYHKFLEANVSHFTGTANVVQKAEAANNFSAGDKLVHSWNAFVDESRFLIGYLYFNSDIFPEFSTYQYLKSLKFIQKMNYLGI